MHLKYRKRRRRRRKLTQVNRWTTSPSRQPTPSSLCTTPISIVSVSPSPLSSSPPSPPPSQPPPKLPANTPPGWEWQNVNLSTRLDAIGGAVLGVASLQAVTYLPYSMFEPYAGDDGGDVTTLNHTLWMAGILSNVTVAETMDLRGELICAEYV